MALDQNYHKLWFESFRLDYISGHKDAIQLRLLKGQNIPQEIIDECQERNADPYSLLTSRNRKLSLNYPVGTQFLLEVKLNDREGRGLFFYTSYKWDPYKIIDAR